jgi:hypothetical protein
MKVIATISFLLLSCFATDSTYTIKINFFTAQDLQKVIISKNQNDLVAYKAVM